MDSEKRINGGDGLNTMNGLSVEISIEEGASRREVQ